MFKTRISNPGQVAKDLMLNYEDWLPDVLNTTNDVVVEVANDLIQKAIVGAIDKLVAAIDVILAIKKQIIADVIAEDRSMQECIDILDNYDNDYLDLVHELLGIDPYHIYTLYDKVEIVNKISTMVTNQDIIDAEFDLQD